MIESCHRIILPQGALASFPETHGSMHGKIALIYFLQIQNKTVREGDSYERVLCRAGYRRHQRPP